MIPIFEGIPYSSANRDIVVGSNSSSVLGCDHLVRVLILGVFLNRS